MSIDIYVLIDHPTMITATEWQQAIDSIELPIKLKQGIDIGKLRGFLPVKLNGVETGFYFSPTSVEELTSEIPDVQLEGSTRWTVYNLNFGGHYLECASAYYSAAALVAKFNGRAFETEGGTSLDSKELRKIGDSCAKNPLGALSP